MRLLDRYLLRELLIPLGLILGALLIFWIAFDLFGRLSGFQEHQLGLQDVVRYYWLRLPEILVLIFPVVLLCALLYALTNHARYNEMTAMRAAGVSLFRICAPYLGVALLFSAGILFINEKVVPDNSEQADQIENLDRRKEKKVNRPDKEIQTLFGFNNGRDDRKWVMESYNAKTHVMLAPRVDEKHPDGSARSIMAKRAEYVNDAWTFYDVQVHSNAPGSFTFPVMQTNMLAVPEFSETPAQLKREIQISKRLSMGKPGQSVEMPILEILDYLDLHPDLSPQNKSWLKTQLQDRLAKPWTCLIVVLVAIPFGAASGRRNVFVGVASALGICFIYFVLQKFGLALGMGGWVPAWIAAWLPNLSFGVVGLWMSSRVR